MRSPRILAALLLLLAPLLLAGLVSSAGPASAAPGDFVPRWCSDDPTPPCLVSATLNGSAVTSSSPDWEIQQTGKLTDIGYPYFQFQVARIGSTAMTTGDHWVLTFDTGSIEPRYTEGFSGTPVVTRTDDGDGTWHVTYDAYPVLTTDGCDSTADWPWPCSTTATGSQMQLYGEVQQKDDLDFNGFDMAQNVDGTNGIFLEKAADGSRYLSTEVVNSHQYDSDPGPGTTLTTFTGQLRFRIPYAMLKNSFDVPNPATMDAGSLSGTVTKPDGTSAPATWLVTNDTAGKALKVDVSGFTFSRKILKVKRGVITPTVPAHVTATRTGQHRGQVAFDASAHRGAKVTGYGTRCVSTSGNHVVTASGSVALLDVTGLHSGTAYDCKVRALSKAGPSKWSAAAHLPAHA